MFPFMVGAFLCPVGLCSMLETVLDDEEDGEGGAQLWWGRRPWDASSGVDKGKTNPGPDLHFVSPNPLWADVPPCPELIPVPSELIDVKKEEI